MLPSEKADKVAELQAGGTVKVAMVGDGVNGAPPPSIRPSAASDRTGTAETYSGLPLCVLFSLLPFCQGL
eukprot:SAG22_NODE_465_length_10181_cov_6.604444_4_plen_70_part_00